MRITIVGLGYVGAVSAACLALKHTVTGVDVNPQKTATLNAGRSPIVEPGLEFRIRQSVRTGNLYATCDIGEALMASDLCFVAVSTPSCSNGEIDAGHLFRACEQIAIAVQRRGSPQPVIIRSSILPRIFTDCCKIFQTLAPGLISPGVNPEFLREGHAIVDFENPPLTVFGSDDAKTRSLLHDLYSGLQGPIFEVAPNEALMVKYASNAFHAAKVVFTNEIAAACRAEQIDPLPVMAAFCRDTSLNISSRYLMPGFAFGGSCLPKDVRAVLHSARHHDIELPMIRSVVESNALVIDRAVQAILATQKRRVGLVGLSFKPSTDDLRESPFVEVAERLLGKGIELAIYDPNVLVTRLVGGNKAYVDDVLPHLSRLMVSSIEELADHSDLLVIGHRFSELETLSSVLSHDISVFDLADLTLVTQLANGDRPCRTQVAPLAAS